MFQDNNEHEYVCQIGEEVTDNQAVIACIEAIDKSIVKKLDLSPSVIGEKTESQKVLEVIAQALEAGYLSHCDLSSNKVKIPLDIFIRMITADGLTTFSLASNTIQGDWVPFLCEKLKNNKTPPYLDLSNVGVLTEEQAELILKALRDNTTVVSMNLSGNSIDGTRLTDKITKLGKKNKTLTQLKLDETRVGFTAKNAQKQAAFLQACEQGKLQDATKLLKQGVSPYTTHIQSQNTGLHLATIGNHVKLVEHLAKTYPALLKMINKEEQLPKDCLSGTSPTALTFLYESVVDPGSVPVTPTSASPQSFGLSEVSDAASNLVQRHSGTSTVTVASSNLGELVSQDHFDEVLKKIKVNDPLCRVVDLCNKDISITDLFSLLEALKENTHVLQLDLSQNNLGRKAQDPSAVETAFAQMLCANRRLSVLNLAGNALVFRNQKASVVEEVQPRERLSTEVRREQALVKISSSAVAQIRSAHTQADQAEDDSRDMPKMTNIVIEACAWHPGLTELNLSGNALKSDTVAEDLGMLITISRSLAILRLSYASLNQAAINNMLERLKARNKKITTLDIRGNQFDIGKTCRALCEVLSEKNKALIDIYLTASNVQHDQQQEEIYKRHFNIMSSRLSSNKKIVVKLQKFCTSTKNHSKDEVEGPNGISKYKCSPYVIDAFDRSLLHLAVLNEQVEVASYLASFYPALIGMLDNNGRSVFDYVEETLSSCTKQMDMVSAEKVKQYQTLQQLFEGRLARVLSTSQPSSPVSEVSSVLDQPESAELDHEAEEALDDQSMLIQDDQNILPKLTSLHADTSVALLNLMNCEIDKEVAEALGNLFSRNKKIQHLLFSGCGFGNDACEHVACFFTQAVESSPYLRSLAFILSPSSEEVYGVAEDDITAIARMLEKNKHLALLSFESTILDATSFSHLLEALGRNSESRIGSLNFEGCGLSSSCGASIAALLSGANCTVSYIHLNRNQLGNDGVTAIANALVKNQTLKMLDLSSNGITDEGASAILEMLKVNKTILSVSLDENQISYDVLSQIKKLLKARDNSRVRQSVVNFQRLEEMPGYDRNRLNTVDELNLLETFWEYRAGQRAKKSPSAGDGSSVAGFFGGHGKGDEGNFVVERDAESRPCLRLTMPADEEV